MSNNRAALGEMLTDLVELGAIEFRPKPLDASRAAAQGNMGGTVVPELW